MVGRGRDNVLIDRLVSRAGALVGENVERKFVKIIGGRKGKYTVQWKVCRFSMLRYVVYALLVHT